MRASNAARCGSASSAPRVKSLWPFSQAARSGESCSIQRYGSVTVTPKYVSETGRTGATGGPARTGAWLGASIDAEAVGGGDAGATGAGASAEQETRTRSRADRAAWRTDMGSWVPWPAGDESYGAGHRTEGRRHSRSRRVAPAPPWGQGA